MLLHEIRIPRVNSLKKINAVVEAVNHGARTDEQIGRRLNPKSKNPARYGRKLRLAAELLGFVSNDAPCGFSLTPRGAEFAKASDKHRDILLCTAVLSTVLVRQIVLLLECCAQGVTMQQAVDFTRSITGLKPEAAHRLTVTAFEWMRTVGALEGNSEVYLLAPKLPSRIVVLEFSDVSEPLMLKPRS